MNFLNQMGEIVLQYGLAGVCIIVLAYCCRNLFLKYCDVQEKRINENVATRIALSENTHALSKLADAMEPNHRA